MLSCHRNYRSDYTFTFTSPFPFPLLQLFLPTLGRTTSGTRRRELISMAPANTYIYTQIKGRPIRETTHTNILPMTNQITNLNNG